MNQETHNDKIKHYKELLDTTEYRLNYELKDDIIKEALSRHFKQLKEWCEKVFK